MTHGPYDPDPAPAPSAATPGAGPDPYGPRFDEGAAARRASARPLIPLMHQVFDGRSVPDPGNPKRRRGFWIAALILISAVTGMQQYGVFKQLVEPKPIPTIDVPEPGAAAKPKELEPLGDDLDQADIAGRLMVKLYHVVQDPKERAQLRGQLEPQVDPLQQVKTEHAVVILPAYVEIAGAEAGLAKIDALRDRIADDKSLSEAEKGQLSNDLDALTRLYSSGSEKLSKEDRERIEQRLGWQGRLALTFDKPDTDPVRAEITANGIALVLFLVVLGLGFLALIPIGLGMFIWACVLLGTGRLRPRLDRPSLGGSIGIEVVVVFLCGFAGLKGVMYVIGFAGVHGWLGAAVKADPEGWLTPVALGLQWIILPMVVFYPRLRGYSRFQVKRALGWHRGEGFLKEMACGIAGYCACLPLYVIGVLIALLLSLLEHMIVKAISGHEPSGPVNPIGGMLAESWWIALLVAVLATVWAPIVEETVFRGALFRQLYARMGLIAASQLSGTVFAMMHGYSPSLFPPLIVLGSGFAIIRWWRGSLVASVTAHALHNGTLMVVMMLLFSLLK